MLKIIQTYFQSIKKLCPTLPDIALQYLVDGLVISEIKPKYFYIQANTVQKEIGYIYSGLLRAFYIDGKGNEITVNFIREGNYATHYTSLEHPKTSKFYFQTVEASVIINIPYKHIQSCCGKFPELERYVRILVEEGHSSILDRMEGFLFDNAETRYLNFVTKNPDLFNRVSLSDLCSYLGIERQSLTRIRKKLSKK
ncbi:Crp/Fnr family transcriptional regulator [Dysgonomonas capnocytophagoides]|uniref:Crp/Fnr family transcriptional regulator n=1 Tax=Dysgonomonas capnocytophagoides TaxID=45254 RepID=UPI0029218901|nr:hypothetical protein DCPSUM001_18910 [Dysgonomonas capnocytophagoides]